MADYFHYSFILNFEFHLVDIGLNLVVILSILVIFFGSSSELLVT